MKQVVLGLGSNVGDSLNYLRNAVQSLSKKLKNIKCSSVYRTKPQGYIYQDDFLNMVVVGEYRGTPNLLLDYIHSIELLNGRDRSHHIEDGPRTLDIDILLFGQQIINTPQLIVPHPAMKKRQFVLIPLLEVLPDCAEPISRIPYKDIQRQLEDQGVERQGQLEVL